MDRQLEFLCFVKAFKDRSGQGSSSLLVPCNLVQPVVYYLKGGDGYHQVTFYALKEAMNKNNSVWHLSDLTGDEKTTRRTKTIDKNL